MINKNNLDIDTIKSKNSIKKIAPEITKWSLIFATCISIIISSENNIKGNKDDWNSNDYKGESKDVIFYNELRNQISFSSYGFIETIALKNDNIVDLNKLKISENKIIKESLKKLNQGAEIFELTLSKKNIEMLKSENIIDSINFLLDSMYGEGYSNILGDGKDHLDKILVINIEETKTSYKLRELSIQDNIQDIENNINSTDIRSSKTNNLTA